jgi:hypothetical protein
MIREIGGQFDVRDFEHTGILPIDDKTTAARQLEAMNAQEFFCPRPKRHGRRSDEDRIKEYVRTGRMPAANYWK